MIEKNVLLPLVEEFINNKCTVSNFSDSDENLKLKSFIKKDDNKCYSIFDRDHSIKCVFDNKFLEEYLSEQPSHVKFESFENSLILIKKYYLDLLIVKNLNKTISLRILLYIQNFEIDVAQKSKDKNIKKNINSNPQVAEMLKNFYSQFSKQCVMTHYKYVNLKAENFIKNEFPIITERGEHYSSKNNSFFKIIESQKNNFLLNTGITIENNQAYEAYTFKEKLEDDFIEIDIEELLKIDFKKIFTSQPSQVLLGRKEGDLSLSGELVLQTNSEVSDKLPVEIKQEMCHYLGKKTFRGDPEIEEKRIEILKNMPDSIKDIIEKYKEKKFTVDIYEKYKTFKSSTNLIKLNN